MFSATKKYIAKNAQQQLVRQPVRHFQQFGKNYMTGFDRMLADKLNWAGMRGWWFAAFGVANALAYGAHLVMTK